jgi:hypothetical protein
MVTILLCIGSIIAKPEGYLRDVGRHSTTIMQVMKREPLPSGSGRVQELHPQAGDADKILIEGDDGEVTLQGGGRNERIHIPDVARVARVVLWSRISTPYMVYTTRSC